MQEMQDQSLGQVDPPEKEMATHASIRAWGISWTEEPGGLQSMGEWDMTSNFTFTFFTGFFFAFLYSIFLSLYFIKETLGLN